MAPLLKQCSVPHCKTIVRDGLSHRCLVHRQSPRRKATIERSKFYNTSSWVNLSKSHRKHYPVCEICSKEFTTETDHMIEISVTEEYKLNPDNLIAVCKSCHWLKSMKMRKLSDNNQQSYLWLYNNHSPREENKNLLNLWRKSNEQANQIQTMG